MATLKICVGGTFDRIHKGHEALLEKAFSEGDFVVIGLTSDEMAQSTKNYSVSPYDARRVALENYLATNGYECFEIVEISDRFGPARTDAIDAIVVSAETRDTAEELNVERRKQGLRPLEILEIGTVLADDCTPISSSRIRMGEISECGEMVRPLIANVASNNKAKIWATRDVFLKLYGRVEVHGIPVPSNVTKQPMNEEAFQGAINRANSSILDGDFGIGIESGVVRSNQSKSHLSVHVCAIVDKLGAITVGQSAGFMLPSNVVMRIKEGSSLAEAVSGVGAENLEESDGAIGFLSGSRISRSNLCESAVLMAMIPRIRRDIYFPH